MRNRGKAGLRSNPSRSGRFIKIKQAPSEKQSAAAYMAGENENGRTRNPFTLHSARALVHVQVRVHLPVDPQGVQLRNATTTTTTTAKKQANTGYLPSLSHTDIKVRKISNWML